MKAQRKKKEIGAEARASRKVKQCGRRNARSLLPGVVVVEQRRGGRARKGEENCPLAVRANRRERGRRRGEVSGTRVYIVYMGAQHSSQYPTYELHLNLLKEIFVNCSPSESLVYSYQRSFSGFAAKLSIDEAEKLNDMEGIVSVFPSKTLKLRTTRSWDFLNLSQRVNRNLTLESDIIIGMIDTGIWPESKSFSGQGLRPPPRKWKGACVNMTCNNKIIGARYYNSLGDYMFSEPSPRDFQGHGTHTASIAAGRTVSHASLYGLAKGMARGAVPSARLAVYKVCWWFGCTDQDILAAFDDAISDGVDIISLSVAYAIAADYFQDSIAIGAFHAMANGILTSTAAGNAGPYRGTVSNVAPWTLVAAASSIDRHIIDKVVTGNHVSTLGASVNTFATKNRDDHPLIYMQGNATILPGDCTALPDINMVKGKIVLCKYFYDEIFSTGIKGLIFIDDSSLDVSFIYPVPFITVSSVDGLNLLNYINNTKNPVANIHKSEEVFDSEAPLVASFSSRGPNTITPDILKPDISAPGIDILAAWSRVAPVSGIINDTRVVKYNIISGTSMACPHVTGVAAYVKSFHPNWSPTAIMSALMTTAKPMYPSARQDELSYGAGQLNPVKAVDPGLVYDAGASDYVQMLCNSAYNETMIKMVTGDASSCSASSKGTVRDLNYPSMALHVQSGKAFAAKFLRTVTNVGGARRCRYKAEVWADHRLNVAVNPSKLKFSELKEKRQFTVSVSGGPLPGNSTAPATVIWSDGEHQVRSVMVVYTD
ncbi:subtilisin-like protease SBT4.3 [Zingiber officinale]|uniref:subtilisin-like protease SBT4.3 n=1 Tax=Zingiber officinale TaxID=94328 RepID=UPI001C4B2556|nr:subtilisin-like protease SBT4.3 [Zingiber officinale]